MYSETLSKDHAVLSNLLEQDDATESVAIEMEVKNFDIEHEDLVNLRVEESRILYQQPGYITKGF